jgi:hypothetical protein
MADRAVWIAYRSPSRAVTKLLSLLTVVARLRSWIAQKRLAQRRLAPSGGD